MMGPNRSWLPAALLAALVAFVTVVTVAAQTPATTTPSTMATAATVQQIVEITHAAPTGAPVAAYTVPTGSRLVITDVIVTNTSTTATCGVSIGRGAQPSVTGPLCVSARSTLALPFATGVEFAGGDAVQISNVAETTTGPGATSATTVSVHLRGFLMLGA